jgi:hypothetical protein
MTPINTRQLATADATATRDMIAKGGNGVPAIAKIDVSRDLAPMMAQIHQTITSVVDSLCQQTADLAKVFERRGGEAVVSRALVVRRDEIVLQCEVKLATD